MNLKTCMDLLAIIDQQNTLIADLVSENLEQENIIKALMKENTD